MFSFSLIRGETVIVERYVSDGVDELGAPIKTWVAETVENVLVAPGPRNDLDTATRPDGTIVVFSLHFPKGYPPTLRGARIRVRGGEPLDVVGDPQHYMEENTPGPWSMPVEVEAVRG